MRLHVLATDEKRDLYQELLELLKAAKFDLERLARSIKMFR